MPERSLLDLLDLPDARGDAVVTERPPKPKHGPYADCTWDETRFKWKLRLNKLGQQFVEAYLKQYPRPANLAHRQAPDRANELFSSVNDGEEAHQLAREMICEAALKFDPEFRSTKTGEKIRPKAYISRFVMGAFWRTYQERFEDVDGMVRPDSAGRSAGDAAAVTWANAETKKVVASDAAAVEARGKVEAVLPLLGPSDRRAVELAFGVGRCADALPLGVAGAAAKMGVDKDELERGMADAFARLRVILGESGGGVFHAATGED